MHGYPPTELYVPTGFFIMITIIVAMNLLAKAWTKGRELMVLARLKERMIERGMSADEIERVIVAGTDKYVPRTPVTTASMNPPPKPQPAPMDWPMHAKN
jgi:hypothetical protein